MKKIIFWFNNLKSLNYWFEYVRKNFGENLHIKYYKNNHIMTIYNIFEIQFKDDRDIHSHVATHNINQYWVEDLFDNNFEEFFYQILRDNLEEIEEDKLLRKIKG